MKAENAMTKEHAKEMRRVVDLHNEAHIANEAVFKKRSSSNMKLGNNSSNCSCGTKTTFENSLVNKLLSLFALLPWRRPATSVSKRDNLI